MGNEGDQTTGRTCLETCSYPVDVVHGSHDVEMGNSVKPVDGELKESRTKRRFDVEFRDLQAFVTDERKQVLTGVSGRVASGEMLAIMGPTGCGKSTLLNALSGRFEGELKGEVLFNGRPGSSHQMKREIAYVTQDDVLPAVLTVRDILLFHARLRINDPLALIEKRVDQVIAQLGL